MGFNFIIFSFTFLVWRIFHNFYLQTCFFFMHYISSCLFPSIFLLFTSASFFPLKRLNQTARASKNKTFYWKFSFVIMSSYILLVRVELSVRHHGCRFFNKKIDPPPRYVRQQISTGVDGGLSRRSSMHRPRSEDPHRPADILQ